MRDRSQLSWFTSYALSGEDKKARDTGCDEYVPKPFSPRHLLAKICNFLE
jgi:two-component system cell cycle response regulator DivK